MGYLEELAQLQGKVAVVIGGAKGIGEATSLALARAGVDLFIGDWDVEALERTRQAIEDLGRKVFTAKVDVLKPAEVEAFYDAVEKRFDGIDILVNLAGGTAKRSFLEMTEETWADDIQRNFRYVVQSTRRAIPLLRKSGRGGSIINFTTMEAHRGAANFVVYAGAKAATENFTRAIAVEFGPDRIRANTIAPDHTHSAGNEAAAEAFIGKAAMAKRARYLRQMWKMRHPLGDDPPPVELAKAVLFLAGGMSAYITGTTLYPDGGTHAAMGLNNWPYGDGFSPNPGPNSLERLFEPDPLPYEKLP